MAITAGLRAKQMDTIQSRLAEIAADPLPQYAAALAAPYKAPKKKEKATETAEAHVTVDMGDESATATAPAAAAAAESQRVLEDDMAELTEIQKEKAERKEAKQQKRTRIAAGKKKGKGHKKFGKKGHH